MNSYVAFVLSLVVLVPVLSDCGLLFVSSSIFFTPQLRSLRGHNALGLSVRSSVRPFVHPYLTLLGPLIFFGNMYARILKIHVCFA